PLCDPVQFEMAAAGQERETFHELAFERPAGSAGEGAVAEVEAELPVLLADEVQDGEACLAGCVAQAPAELLEEHRDALGWPEEQDGVDVGDVEAFVEHVNGEHAAQGT